MATVFKRRDARPIPKGAEIITYRGKPYARWTNRKTGKTQRAPLNKAQNRIIQEAESYTAQYFDENGKRQKTPTGCRDKDAALQVANQIEADIALRKRGIFDTTQERFAAEARRPLAEHVEDYREYLSAKDNTARHVRATCRHIETIAEGCHAQHIGQLTGADVMRAIGDRRDGGASLRTCNSYLQSVKSFSRWLWREKRTPDDALVALSGFNEETDRRHIRRELTPEELAYLMPFVEGHTTSNHNLAGPDRAMVYRLALGTGFRAAELRSLTPESFDLDADPPNVTAEACYTKRRRRDVQPIRRDLAELLRTWLAGRPRGVRLFSALPENTARMLRTDLHAARARWISGGTTDTERQRRQESDFLTYEDADGRFADFTPHDTPTYQASWPAGHRSRRLRN